MSNYIVDGADLTSVANAIRTKGGTSALLAFPADFVDAIDDIETGGGGDYVASDFADPAKPTGRFTLTQSSWTYQYLAYRSAITHIYAPNWTGTSNTGSMFNKMTALTYAVLPKCARLYNGSFSNCGDLIGVDFYGGPIGSTVFASCHELNLLVIRRTDAISGLSNTNSFSATAFKSGGAGGDIYIPKVLFDHFGDGSSLDFKSATNWSTVDGWGATTWHPIEGSIYETQYVDGTPIPTE